MFVDSTFIHYQNLVTSLMVNKWDSTIAISWCNAHKNESFKMGVVDLLSFLIPYKKNTISQRWELSIKLLLPFWPGGI